MNKWVGLAGIACALGAAACLSYASGGASQASDPRVILEFPTVLVGFEAVCTPRRPHGDGSSASLPRDYFTSSGLGEVTSESVELQVVADILRVQAACARAGVVFGPGEPLRLSDGSEARVFHSRPAEGVRPVSVVYVVQRGSLQRYSMWLPSTEDLSREYPRFMASIAALSLGEESH